MYTESLHQQYTNAVCWRKCLVLPHCSQTLAKHSLYGSQVSAISPSPVSPTYYRLVPFRLLMENVCKHNSYFFWFPLIEIMVVP